MYEDEDDLSDVEQCCCVSVSVSGSVVYSRKGGEWVLRMRDYAMVVAHITSRWDGQHSEGSTSEIASIKQPRVQKEHCVTCRVYNVWNVLFRKIDVQRMISSDFSRGIYYTSG